MFSWARCPVVSGRLGPTITLLKARRNAGAREESLMDPKSVADSCVPALPAFLPALVERPVQRRFNRAFFLCVALRPLRLRGDLFFFLVPLLFHRVRYRAELEEHRLWFRSVAQMPHHRGQFREPVTLVGRYGVRFCIDDDSDAPIVV